jgi:hypothetical protein
MKSLCSGSSYIGAREIAAEENLLRIFRSELNGSGVSFV